MDRDSLADLPAASRRAIVTEVCAVLDVEAATAEDLVRSAEPLWDAMERAGGLVDSWGGGEFCYLFPRVLAFIRAGPPAGGLKLCAAFRRRLPAGPGCRDVPHDRAGSDASAKMEDLDAFASP